MFGSKCTTDDDIEDDIEDAEDAARGRSMVLLSSRDRNKAPPRRRVPSDKKNSRQNLTHFEQPKAAKKMATTSTSAVEEWKTPADARRRGAETKVRFVRYCPPESPMSKPGEFVVRRERVF
jgi:hypothetical protein